MIEIRITKEIGNYEPKLLGPFTARQVVCLIIAVPICVVIFKTFSPIFTPDIAGFFCALPASVAALFGWYKPYGMKTEKFIQSVWINMFMAPTHRRYRSENQHEIMLEKLAAEYDRIKEIEESEKSATENKLLKKGKAVFLGFSKKEKPRKESS